MADRRIENPFEKSLDAFLGSEEKRDEEAVEESSKAEEKRVGVKRTSPTNLRGIPKRRGVGKSRRKGLREGYVRYSFVVRENILDNMKALAWWRREDIYRVMEDALSDYLKKKSVREELEKAADKYKKSS